MTYRCSTYNCPCAIERPDGRPGPVLEREFTHVCSPAAHRRSRS
jgi:hypothetical protein